MKDTLVLLTVAPSKRFFSRKVQRRLLRCKRQSIILLLRRHGNACIKLLLDIRGILGAVRPCNLCERVALLLDSVWNRGLARVEQKGPLQRARRRTFRARRNGGFRLSFCHPLQGRCSLASCPVLGRQCLRCCWRPSRRSLHATAASFGVGLGLNVLGAFVCVKGSQMRGGARWAQLEGLEVGSRVRGWRTRRSR